ncbi:MAG: RlpA-like double-psi beta-barrel domain-containing protein [Patescibacteria group bacterium]
MARLSQIFLKTLLFLLLVLAGNFVFASEDINKANNPNREYSINLDQETINKGYTVSAFDSALKLSLSPGVLSESTGVEVLEINEEMEMPWQMDKISKVYQFEFKNKIAHDNHKPFYIQFSYNQATNNYKQVYFYDKNYSSWRPLPTKDYNNEKFVRSLIHLPFARIVVLSNPDILTIGKASWYAYKGGNFTASPDFPKESRLRVYNIANNKFVDVEVNDYGPDRKLHPNRAVDLDKAAFIKIASLEAGVADVRIEPLYIAPDNQGRVLGTTEKGATFEPVITSKSAIIMREKDEEIIWEKNATTTLPLASLTKLVAVEVFIDTKPSLDRVIAYSVKDEEYNYQYVNKWESARLNLNDGDTITIEDLIYSSLVGSANNTIETLVRISGLSRDNFIKEMNDTVVSWGAVSTHFIEPTGLAPENVSSPLDYAIITKNVFINPIIQKASTMPEYEFYTINTKIKHKLRNTNRLIKTNNYNIIGSKTGYLDEAGYCLMTRVEANENRLIIITFGSENKEISYMETEDLIKYGLRKLE